MSWWSRLRNAVHPRQLDESLDDEIRDHLERRAASLREDGLTPEEAERRARAAFGNITRIREESREVRLWAGLEATMLDMRYGWRSLRRNPAFTISAVLSLTLAIGANTAIFAIVDAAVLRPLPVPDAARVFTLSAPALDPGAATGSGEIDRFSYPVYRRLQAAAGDAARLALFGPTDQVDAQAPRAMAPAVRVAQQFVSGDAFEMLRVSPATGRLLSGDDNRGAGDPRVAVLGFEYWRRQFGGDPGVVGQPITLNGRPFRIVGVAAETFFGVEPGRFIDVWLPVTAFDPGVFSNPDANLFRIVGRVSDGVSAEQLQARLQAAFHARQQDVIARNRTLPAAVLEAYAARQIVVRPGGVGASDVQRNFARPVWIVWGVTATLLLVACANLAGLLLSRSASRSSELLLRTSLGASRGRLLRQLLTESAVLTALSSGLGVCCARLAAPWLVTWLSTDGHPVWLAVSLDRRVLLFHAGICAISAVIAGVVPAWHGSRIRALSALTPASGERRRLALGRGLVSAQVAFVFCLVVAGAGFLISLHRLFTVDPGFDPRHVTMLTMRSDLGPKQDGLTLTQRLQAQVSMLPNVQGAAVAWSAMFGDSRRAEQVVIEGRPPSERQEIFYRVSPGYFATVRIPLLDGRDFGVRDTDGVEPIPTIVNRSFARRYFGGDDVVGREFRRRTDNARHVIVGLAADAYYSDLRDGLQPIAYFPMKPPRFFTMYIRSTLDPGSIGQLVDHEAAAATPGLHVVEVTTLETRIGNTLLKEKLLAGVSGVFASLGLGLVAIGLFGLLNYSVVRRTREIGIRAALGAQRHALISMVLRELFVMVAGGLAAGLLGSLGLVRLIGSQLYGVATVDPVVITAACTLLVMTTAFAVVLPVYRAATIDPLIALRRD
jgi:predicted permease